MTVVKSEPSHFLLVCLQPLICTKLSHVIITHFSALTECLYCYVNPKLKPKCDYSSVSSGLLTRHQCFWKYQNHLTLMPFWAFLPLNNCSVAARYPICECYEISALDTCDRVHESRTHKIFQTLGNIVKQWAICYYSSWKCFCWLTNEVIREEFRLSVEAALLFATVTHTHLNSPPDVDSKWEIMKKRGNSWQT